MNFQERQLNFMTFQEWKYNSSISWLSRFPMTRTNPQTHIGEENDFKHYMYLIWRYSSQEEQGSLHCELKSPEEVPQAWTPHRSLAGLPYCSGVQKHHLYFPNVPHPLHETSSRYGFCLPMQGIQKGLIHWSLLMMDQKVLQVIKTSYAQTNVNYFLLHTVETEYQLSAINWGAFRHDALYCWFWFFQTKQVL